MGLGLLLVWFFYCDIGHAHVHDSHVSDAFAEQELSIDAVVGLKERKRRHARGKGCEMKRSEP